MAVAVAVVVRSVPVLWAEQKVRKAFRLGRNFRRQPAAQDEMAGESGPGMGVGARRWSERTRQLSLMEGGGESAPLA